MFTKFLALLVVIAVVNAESDPQDPARIGQSALKVINNAAADIIDTYVYLTNDIEWGPFNAPQYNFKRLSIASGSYLERPEDVNLNAQGSRFSMRLTFSDGTFDEYRVNQQYVFDKSPDFSHIYGSRLIKYGKGENKTLEITIVDRQ